MKRTNLLWVLALAPGWIACSGGADIPATPDLTTLQRQYDNPTATLDQTTVTEAAQSMPNLARLAAAFRASGFVATSGIETGGDDAGGEAATNLNIQGSLKITAQCPGALDQAAFGGNGTLSLTLGVEKNLIKRGVSAVATHCVLRGQTFGKSVRVEVDGPVAFDLGGPLGFRKRWSGTILMHIDRTLDIEGITLEDVSARWTEDRLEYLYTLPNGSGSVVGVLTTEGSIEVRTKDRTWRCPDGETCTVP